MTNMLKIEFKKLFRSVMFWAALAIMLVIAILSAVYMIENCGSYNPDIIEAVFIKDGQFTSNPDMPIMGFYQSWIGGESLSLMCLLFYTLIPVAAALAYSWSYHTEKKCGYLKNIASRTHKKCYFIAKSIVVFCSGCLVILIPLVVNVFVVSAFVPLYHTWAGYIMYNHIYFGDLWADLFFSNPFMHMVLYVLLDTIYAGLFALLSFTVSYYISNLFAIIFIPFVTMLGFSYLESIAASWWRFELVPSQFLHASAMHYKITGPVVFSVFLLLFVFSITTIVFRGIRREIY